MFGICSPSIEKLTSEFVMKCVGELDVQTDQTSCCNCVRLQPGVALPITGTQSCLSRDFLIIAFKSTFQL